MGDTVNTFSNVKRAGHYRCVTCEAPLKLEVGEEAPHCYDCKRPVTWEFVRPKKQPIGFVTS
jgi:hypothetical protein